MSQNRVVVVVRASPAQTVLWKVDLNAAVGRNRLLGGWINPGFGTLHRLLAQGWVLPFPDSAHVYEDLATTQFDPTGTGEAMATELARLAAIHDASRDPDGNQNPPITWPTPPSPLNYSHLPTPPVGVTADTAVAEVISVATWVADLAHTWNAIEVLRCSRDYLRLDATDPRPLPVVTM